MREWGKTIAIDLIRWILLFFNAYRMRQHVWENPRMNGDVPLATAALAPVRARSGGRLSRGPTALHRRSDL
jgi:hypothetical protein